MKLTGSDTLDSVLRETIFENEYIFLTTMKKYVVYVSRQNEVFYKKYDENTKSNIF